MPLEDAAPLPTVTITLDGAPIAARDGEPVAAALVRAGALVLSRSPKYHRPRGVACMRGGCDGCLARVDGVPNVMTCLVPARDGMEVVSQNHIGSRTADVLRMTDWFFPNGMNHHELLAGIPGLSDVMQSFARRVAGLGRLPSEGGSMRSARRREADVLVVGAGPSGLAAAARLALRGRSVDVFDDAPHVGGTLRAGGAEWDAGFAETMAHVARAVDAGSLRIHLESVVGACFGDDVLVSGPSGAEIISPRAVLVAAGGHDTPEPFENNDLAGVMSARSLGLLASHGVRAGTRVVVVRARGGGGLGDAVARAYAALPDAGHVVVVDGAPVRASGSTRLRALTVRGEDGRERSIPCDVAAIDGPRAPAHELASQLGAALDLGAHGYVPRRVRGRVSDIGFVTGEAAGLAFDVNGLVADAHDVADHILEASR